MQQNKVKKQESIQIGCWEHFYPVYFKQYGVFSLNKPLTKEKDGNIFLKCNLCNQIYLHLSQK